VFDEPVFHDTCRPYDSDEYAEGEKCHLVSGWSTGVDTCSLWEQIKKLCQTESEQRFLHQYLRLVKDRQFPMLVPQASIGIGERRRPDFVIFIPLQRWSYRWMAVEIDGGHDESKAQADEQRNADLKAHGYEVFSVRPTGQRYFEEARRLVERVEAEMNLADTERGKVAVVANVTHTTPPSDGIPF
jgi:hypothetical protein